MIRSIFHGLLKPRKIKACHKCRSKSKSYFDFQCFCKKRKVVEIFLFDYSVRSHVDTKLRFWGFFSDKANESNSSFQILIFEAGPELDQS